MKGLAAALGWVACALAPCPGAFGDEAATPVEVRISQSVGGGTLPAETLGAHAVRVTVAQSLDLVQVVVDVDEPPGPAMGVDVAWTQDGGEGPVHRVSYRPQDVRSAEWTGPPGFPAITRFETRPDHWSLGVEVRPALDASGERILPFRMAVAVTGRAPNRVAFAPPGAAFAGPASWARIVSGEDVQRSAFAAGWGPRDPASRPARDEKRLAGWREHLAERGKGPPETLRERLMAPLDRAIEARPDLVMLHVVKGDVLRDLGDPDGAERAYDEGVKFGPHFPEALWGRERLRAARWVRRPPGEASDYAAAFSRIAEESKALAADSPAPAIAEGFLRHRAGEFEAAERLLGPFEKTHAFDDEVVETVRLARAARELWGQELALRRADDAKGDLPRVRLETSEGPVLVELFEDDAPNTVANFLWLATPQEPGKPGFYDGTRFHATAPFAFVAGGAPSSAADGAAASLGGPGWAIRTERVRRRPFRGTVAMDADGLDTAGSRFRLLTGTTVLPEGSGAVFGRVVEGGDVVERLAAGSRLERVVVVRKRDHAYRPTTVAGEAAPAPRR